jgi:hypothetical protein
MADELLASKLADVCDPILTLAQWATGLGVSEKQIRTWIETRRLRAYRLASGHYIVVRASLRGLVPPDTEALAQRKILERERMAAEQGQPKR